MTNLNVAAFLTVLLFGNIVDCSAQPGQPASVVDFEGVPAGAQPVRLQGYLRHPNGAALPPAVVMLHGCGGRADLLDRDWAAKIASWGYVTLTIDSFGPRGLKNTCDNPAPVDLAFDGYRGLNYLVRQQFVDPKRVALLGFSQGGWLTLWSVERGAIEQMSENKFRAAAAFYPPCNGSKGVMTIPTLILIGESDDWTPAEACRKMVDGQNDWGISRQKGEGAVVRLVVYPNAYHGFDKPAFKTPIRYLGHHLEFNQSATDQSAVALREFLDATIGRKE
jgi:dienelactone hydrolase